MSATNRTGRAALADADLERLSAWLDGELDAPEHRLILERLKSDPELRAQFEWFHLAGDALRSHEVAACHQPRLVVRVCEAVRAEPVRIGPRLQAGAGTFVRRHVASAVALAAAAGTLVVVALPQLRGTDAQSIQTAVQVPAAVRPATLANASTSSESKAGNAASVANVANATAARSPQLDAYLQAHREMASTGVMPAAVAYIRTSGEPER